MCGVYYLWDGAVVIYVGQSTHIENRIASHRATRLDFAGYFVDEYPEQELNEREAKAIAEFKPKLNESSNLQA